MNELKSKKKPVHLVLRAVVSIGILIILCTKIDFPTMWSFVRSSHMGLLWLTLGLALFERCMMVIKLWFILRIKNIRTPFWHLYKVVLSTTFVGKYAPTSLGVDLFRIYGLSRATQNTVETVSTVLMDRFLGMVTILIMAGIAFFYGDYLQQEKEVYLALGLLMLLLAGLIVGFFPAVRSRAARLMNRIPFVQKYVSKLGQVAHSFYGFRHHAWQLVFLFVLSVIFQSGRVLIPYTVSRAIGLNIPVTYFFIFVPIVIVVSLLPFSIGGLGIREGGTAYFLTQAGATMNQAVGIALLIFVVTQVAGLPGGIIYLLEGFGRVKKQAAEMDASC